MGTFREDGPWSNDDVIETNRYGLRSALAIAQPTGQFLVTNSWDAAGRWQTVGGTAGTFTYAYPADTASSLPVAISLPGGGYITNQYDALARLTRTELRTSGTARRSRNETVAATELRTLHGPYAPAPRCPWRLRRPAERVEQIHRIGVIRSNTELCRDGTRPDPRRLLARCASELRLQAVQCPAFAAAGILPVPARRNRNTRWTSTTVETLAAVPIAVNRQCTRIHANDRRSNPATRDFSVGPHWTYIYNHENWLTCVQTDTYYTPESYRFKVEFVYDGQGRMRIKRNYIWSGDGWYGSGGETRYLYDGMLIVQERDSGNMPTVTYSRGRDLSGTVDGAGGIGGLLGRSHGYSSGSWTYHNFYHSDGNGNVTALVNSSGTLQASYIYDPYGRHLSGTGTLLTSNVMRFSSKPWVSFLSSSATSGLYYYGYRFYDPYLQRWLNRDQVDESTPFNLYLFVANDPMRSVDAWGLYEERQNSRGSSDIIVDNCEIVILYGHGSLQNPHRFVFNGPFSFGHFVGCGDESTNQRIRRKGRHIPGAPSTVEDLHSGPSARWHPDLMFAKHLDEAIAAARKLAKALCDSGKCKRVVIYTVAAGPESPMNPLGSNSHLPPESKEVVECCTGK